jgi:hypothetical protein
VLNLHVESVVMRRTLSSVRLGVVVSLWEDGTITAHEPDDPMRHRQGVPLLSMTRASEVPTVAAIAARLRAAATLRGVAAVDE